MKNRILNIIICTILLILTISNITFVNAVEITNENLKESLKDTAKEFADLVEGDKIIIDNTQIIFSKDNQTIITDYRIEDKKVIFSNKISGDSEELSNITNDERFINNCAFIFRICSCS